MAVGGNRFGQGVGPRPAARGPDWQPPLLLSWDGQSWRRQTIPDDRVSATAGTDLDDIWLVGRDILHCTGRGFERHSPAAGVTLHAVCASSRQDAWAVGNRGLALHWDGRSLDPVAHAGGRRFVRRVVRRSGRCVGRGGPGDHLAMGRRHLAADPDGDQQPAVWNPSAGPPGCGRPAGGASSCAGREGGVGQRAGQPMRISGLTSRRPTVRHVHADGLARRHRNNLVPLRADPGRRLGF